MNLYRYYDSILREFVPDLTLKIEHCFFIKEGKGAGNINCFRKVKIGSDEYFEKVYLSKHREWNVAEWFDRYVYRLIYEEIRLPELFKSYEGKLLSIRYYKYLALSDGCQQDIEDIIAYAIKLYRLSLNIEEKMMRKDIPPFILDFKEHSHYKRFVVKAGMEMNRNGISLVNYEETISKSKLILTHGDLNYTNLYEENYLIDWDEFGLYPIGFEIAYLYYRNYLHEKRELIEEFEPWIERKFRTDIIIQDWLDLVKNSKFFLYVFSFRFDDCKEINQYRDRFICELKAE